MKFKIDSYVLFIIKAFNLMKLKGVCSFIIPNTILKNDKYILKRKMNKFELTRDYVKQLDNEDKLAKYKERFYINEGELYMDGNSCGLCSIDAEDTLMEALNAWKNLGIGIWSSEQY